MSYADRVFIENCTEILNHGFWDTDLPVRPRWEDGTPAHTVKKFGIVNRYDHKMDFPILTIRRTAFKSAIDEIQQHSRSEQPYLGCLGRRDGLYRQGVRLPAGNQTPISRGHVRSGRPCVILI